MQVSANWCWWLIVAAILTTLPACATIGTRRAAAPVPPDLEIEVLDPGRDPLGNPAVVPVDYGEPFMEIDIPPVVLVHRYYYSGDRSFQGPMLPGGPTIAVVDHPVTGERRYLQLQMMPGAPRVYYTGKAIEYDFGTHAAIIRFPRGRCPEVVYRSGEPWHRHLAQTVHADRIQTRVQRLHEHCRQTCRRGHVMVRGAALEAWDNVKIITLPIQHLARAMPFVNPALSTDWEARWGDRLAQHQHDMAIREAEREARLSELDRPTLR